LTGPVSVIPSHCCYCLQVSTCNEAESVDHGWSLPPGADWLVAVHQCYQNTQQGDQHCSYRESQSTIEPCQVAVGEFLIYKIKLLWSLILINYFY